MHRSRALILSIALAVAGCASTTTSTTPAQTVFAAKSAYATALTAAVAYKRLPACSSTQPMPCSDAGVVQQLQRADNVAASALDAAESAVRTPAIGADARSKAIQTATVALQALQAITTTIGAKP
jgi:uncharacterized protein YcfL